jgi:hypothetical protein
MEMLLKDSLLSRGTDAVLLLALLTIGCAQGGDGDPAVVANAVSTTSSKLSPAGTTPRRIVVPGRRSVDPACVFEVPNGARVDAQGNVISNGVTIAHHEPCTPEQMGVKTSIGADGIELPTIGHEWVAWTNASAQLIGGLSQFNFLNANFTVPPLPAQYTNQVIYLFPSFEGANEGTEIIQPILQFGNNNGFGGDYWTMVNWYIGPNGSYHTPPWTVAPGDVIYGQMGVETQGFWYCSTTDETTGINTQMGIYVYTPFKTVQSGVLEVYNISNCNQYPQGSVGLEEFYNVQISQAGPYFYTQNWVNPAFATNMTAGLSPWCGYGAFYGSGYADITF